MWEILIWEAREVWNVGNIRFGSKGSMECGNIRFGSERSMECEKY